MPGPRRGPPAEVSGHAPSVAPSVDPLHLQASAQEQRTKPPGRKAPVVAEVEPRNLVHLDQEWRRDDDVTTGCRELAEVRRRAPRVGNVLEDLLADHDVEPALDGDRRAEIKVRVIQTRVLAPRLSGMRLAAYLGGGQARGTERRDVGVHRPV